MLFDIFNYNITLALSSLISLFFVFFLIFKKFITTLADPLVFHLIWLSSIGTFFVIFFEKYNIDSDYLILLNSYFIYIFSLVIFFYLFHKSNTAFKKENISYLCPPLFAKRKLLLLIIISFIVFLFSQKGFLAYAFKSSNISELFLYRYVNLQGRDPFSRVAFEATPFFLLFNFYSIHHKLYKKTSLLFIFFYLIISIVSGGRSSLINLILSIGFYIFFFQESIRNSTFRKINLITIFCGFIAILTATLVTSFYPETNEINSASNVIFNRIFASADGVEYYLKYNASSHLQSGLVPYLYSIFGIYIKYLTTDIEIKNIGWQLTELVIGNVTFAQGANYIFLLQAIIFSKYLAPIYTFLIALFVAKIRYCFVRNRKIIPLLYALSSLAFSLPLDIEYFFLQLLSIIILYLLLYLPIISLRLK